MSDLSTIAERFEEFADGAVSDALAEGRDFVGKVAEDAENAFEDLVEKLGQRATTLVTGLFSDDSVPTGTEKANLAATQLVEHAASTGIALAAHDATAIIKSAFLAVEAKIATL